MTPRPANIDWTPLKQEFDAWRAADLTLPIWWRDDDAIAPSTALDRLVALSRSHGIPVHLAVIPAQVQSALGETIAASPDTIPVVHGWAHANHADATEKKCEFGNARDITTCVDDATRALHKLQCVFGKQLAPVFVPPWNRIRPDLIASLRSIGYHAVSTFGPRTAAEAAPGLARINTHLDPIFWRGTRSLVDPSHLVARLCDDLAARREGRADNDEPYGVLTHHLVHDRAIWDFTAALLEKLASGPVAIWRADRDLTTEKETP